VPPAARPSAIVSPSTRMPVLRPRLEWANVRSFYASASPKGTYLAADVIGINRR
jgi:hypothetical protein